MGIAYTKITSGNSSLGLWHITETVEALTGSITLSPYDQEILETKKSTARKKEWLAIRNLLAAMTGQIHQIKYHADGRPYLSDTHMNISISHSQNYACIYLNQTSSAGVDIQILKPDITAGSGFFMHESEAAWIDPADNVLLHIIWSAKESTYKYCRISDLDIKTDLIISPFIRNQIGTIEVTIMNNSFPNNLFLEYSTFENYILTRTL